jgi:hypothetical protein
MTAGLPRSRNWRDRSHSPADRNESFRQTPGLFANDEPIRGRFMTPTPTLASSAVARTGAGEAGTAAAGAAEPGPYVLNLCSSTTPMALEQAQLPELKRFSFFVSRRREDGRERFRLHMGYFATIEEAEEWLNVVRDIYPGAWAGETPGKKLRERAAAEESARSAPQPAAPRAPTATTAQPGIAAGRATASAVNTAAQVALSRGAVPINVPTLQAAVPTAPAIPVARAAPVQRAQAVQPVPGAVPAAGASSAPAVKAPAAATRSVPQPQVSASANAAARAAAANSRPGAPVKPQAQKPAAPVAPRAPVVSRGGASTRNASPPAKTAAMTAASLPASAAPLPSARTVAQPAGRAPAAPARSASTPAGKAPLPSSNVREVLAALDEPTGETRVMPAPALALRTDDATLTDTQVLRFLETRRDEDDAKADEESASGSISLLKPDDTGTRRALKEAVVQNAPVSFAVQLQWSVQPVELEKVPPLAIFSAYTLYTVEGSRDGRKWYGLRLGFFTDAISAKQVAYYVRSEFASVAVVPVSPQERNRASEDEQKASGLAFPKRTRREPVEEFKLIDSDEPPATPPARQPAAQGAKPTARPSAPQPPASGRRAGKVRAREHRSPQTLEETLEILGASQLEIDNGRGEILNESGVRHLRVEMQKNTPFRRLIERLSERVRKT